MSVIPDAVVCDASPLIFLAKLDALHLIQGLLEPHVTVLRCVADEILSPSAGILERRRLEEFLNTVSIVDFSGSDYETHALSEADCRTLTYAVRVKASWLVVDERLLRRVSVAEGLRVVGFLSLLIDAARSGAMSAESVKQLVETAISDHQLRISLQLYRKLIAILEEVAGS